ncbi:hypothetical protein ACXWQM_09875, partial [Streptococcus pyogenes]
QQRQEILQQQPQSNQQTTRNTAMDIETIKNNEVWRKMRYSNLTPNELTLFENNHVSMIDDK